MARRRLRRQRGRGSYRRRRTRQRGGVIPIKKRPKPKKKKKSFFDKIKSLANRARKSTIGKNLISKAVDKAVDYGMKRAGGFNNAIVRGLIVPPAKNKIKRVLTT